MDLVCQNGGTCVKNSTNDQLRCACPSGYNGSHCQTSQCENYCAKVYCTICIVYPFLIELGLTEARVNYPNIFIKNTADPFRAKTVKTPSPRKRETHKWDIIPPNFSCLIHPLECVLKCGMEATPADISLLNNCFDTETFKESFYFIISATTCFCL